MKKLYCYVDESGQDAKSEIFVIFAVVTAKDQDIIRKKLIDIEREAKTNKLKWHKTRHDRRLKYLTLVLDRKIASGEVYTAHYKKPIPYFFPIIDLLEKAIKDAISVTYKARIYVDGIDKQKAKQLTNALRASGISLRMVKSRRDESEPIIRLADMWAGCIRSSLLGHEKAKQIVEQAKSQNYLHQIPS